MAGFPVDLPSQKEPIQSIGAIGCGLFEQRLGELHATVHWAGGGARNTDPSTMLCMTE
jgi:hypothetical protein